MSWGELTWNRLATLGTRAAERWSTSVRGHSVLAAIGAGAVLMILAMIYVAPTHTRVGDHARLYEQLSLAPLDFAGNAGNAMQLRLLTPLLGFLVGLRGETFFLLVLLISAVFLSVICGYFARQGYSWIEAFGMAAMMAFSIPVAATIHWRGYTDPTTYLLLFLAIVFIRRLWLWPILFGLALWDHERALFAAPWLLWLSFMEDRRPGRVGWAVFVAGVFVVATVLARQFVDMNVVDVLYSADYSLNMDHVARSFEANRGLLFLGVFSAFRLFWFWPLYAMYRLWQSPGTRMTAAWLGLVIMMALGQLMLAWDVSRMMGLAFAAILFGAHEVRKLWGPKIFARRLWLLIGFNFLVPNFVVHSVVEPLFSLPAWLVYTYGFGWDPWVYLRWDYCGFPPC